MKFNNYLLELGKNKNNKNKEGICLYGVSSIIKEIYLDLKKQHHRKLIKKISTELKIPYQTLYSWVSGSNSIPISKAFQLLKLWKDNCEKSNLEFDNIWNRAYKENKGFSQNGQRKVILPREFSEDLAYITGFFQGDGHLKKENLNGFQEYSIYFYEADKEFLNKLNKKIHQLFGIKGNIYYQSNKTGKWYTLRISSKPIYLFLKRVLNLKSGRKVRNIEVPKIIKESGELEKLSFIQGFFDAEGGVGETIKNPWLDIGQASKDNPCEILCWIQKELVKRGVFLSSPKRTQNQEFFRIRTSKRETIKRFFETISSCHPEKINKFNQIILKNG